MRRLLGHRGLDLAFCAIALVLACSRPAGAQIPDPERLGRARAFDQLGVRAFREGRYRDAVRFFEAASQLGGPSSEIWNMARCYQRLDEPEEAMRALERYLEQSDLMPSERAEAAKELDDLRARPSQLAVDSDPSGAAVSVDGKPLPSPTPVSSEIAPGTHRVRIERPGGPVHETMVEARLGRAVVVSVPLGGSPGSQLALAPSDAVPVAARRFLFSVEGGAFVARFGSEQGGPRPSAHLAADYVFNPEARVLATAGLRLSFWSYGGPGWHTSPQCQLADGASPAELGALATAGLAVRAGQRFRLGGDVGLGLAGLAFGASGTGAGKPGCTDSSGVAVLAHAGLRGSFALSQAVRFTFSPLAFEAHPAFHGARENPPSTVDASGLWWRLGTTMGFAFDAK